MPPTCLRTRHTAPSVSAFTTSVVVTKQQTASGVQNLRHGFTSHSMPSPTLYHMSKAVGGICTHDATCHACVDGAHRRWCSTYHLLPTRVTQPAWARCTRTPPRLVRRSGGTQGSAHLPSTGEVCCDTQSTHHTQHGPYKAHMLRRHRRSVSGTHQPQASDKAMLARESGAPTARCLHRAALGVPCCAKPGTPSVVDPVRCPCLQHTLQDKHFPLNASVLTAMHRPAPVGERSESLRELLFAPPSLPHMMRGRTMACGYV